MKTTETTLMLYGQIILNMNAVDSYRKESAVKTHKNDITVPLTANYSGQHSPIGLEETHCMKTNELKVKNNRFFACISRPFVEFSN